MRLGEKIRKLRRERDWTQDELGKRAKLNGRHLNRIEKGHVYPNEATIGRLARSLDLEPAQLLEDVDDATPPARVSRGARKHGDPLEERIRDRLGDVRHLPAEDQEALIRVVDAMLARVKIQKLISS